MDLHHVITKVPSLLLLPFLLLLTIPRDAHSMLYAQTLNLDFLCSPVDPTAYVRDIPWDCASYVICMRGQAIPTECPQGKLYASARRNSKCEPSRLVDPGRCRRRIWDYIPSICRANPKARVPSPEGCSHFFDCTVVNGGQHDLMTYLVECPYPSLFSKQTGGCRDFRLVYCGERKEPKAPCEYLQYMQLYDCVGPNCVTCSKRHPSCVGRLNGPQFVPDRHDFLMECSNERTVTITPSSSSSSSSTSSSTSDSSPSLALSSPSVLPSSELSSSSSSLSSSSSSSLASNSTTSSALSSPRAFPPPSSSSSSSSPSSSSPSSSSSSSPSSSPSSSSSSSSVPTVASQVLQSASSSAPDQSSRTPTVKSLSSPESSVIPPATASDQQTSNNDNNAAFILRITPPKATKGA